ncbi:uncharacterized protein V3H82_014539 [Fundulus diaphanus]
MSFPGHQLASSPPHILFQVIDCQLLPLLRIDSATPAETIRQSSIHRAEKPGDRPVRDHLEQPSSSSSSCRGSVSADWPTPTCSASSSTCLLWWCCQVLLNRNLPFPQSSTSARVPSRILDRSTNVSM